MTEAQKDAVVNFVIAITSATSSASTSPPRTVNNVLNVAGYYWRPVPRLQNLSREHLGKRKDWVDGHIDYPPSWWESRLNLVLDGVTLTMPTKTLHGREKHAA